MLSDAVKNARHTPQVITWLDTDGDPLVLTGAVITGRILDTATDVARDMDGTMEVTNGDIGEFSWTYGANDVGTSGDFLVQFTATFSVLVDKTLLTEWTVIDAI